MLRHFLRRLRVQDKCLPLKQMKRLQGYTFETVDFCQMAEGFSGKYKILALRAKRSSDKKKKTHMYKFDRVTSIESLDEERYSNWAAKAGWGLGIGVLTGGLGLIAGAAIAGNNRDQVVRLILDDGEWIVVTLKRKQVKKLPKHLAEQLTVSKYGLDVKAA